MSEPRDEARDKPRDEARDKPRDEARDKPALPVAIPVTGDLDLHSFAPREIPALVEDYVQECRERGILRVRLAHGRGRGVQRAVVRRALLALPHVVSVADAVPEAGGWGATIAVLRPRDPRAE